MPKYKIERSFCTMQNQIVEAPDEDEAQEIADENNENFENTMNCDTDWQYTITEME